jgi:hypothetical protein
MPGDGVLFAERATEFAVCRLTLKVCNQTGGRAKASVNSALFIDGMHETRNQVSYL